jgi:hypothetical protein
MRTPSGTLLATALLTLISANAGAQHYDAGRSLEADQHDERAEGASRRWSNGWSASRKSH